VPLAANSGSVGYIMHKGDTKDHAGADQRHTRQPGRNEIWRIEGDNATYTRNPDGATAPDIRTLRVHYKRFAGDYANWGLHLWPTSGIDTARIPVGVAIDQWSNAVRFNQMPGYAAGADEVVFDIPVLNPSADATRTGVEFIIHGLAPNQDDKDGRPVNIRVSYASLNNTGQVGEIWMVQGDPTVYTSPPDTRSASTRDTRAVWLNRSLIRWPRVAASGTVKLYHSATGQISAPKDGRVNGADGSITLDAFTGTVPTALMERFKWLDAGAVFSVRAGDQARVPTLPKSQLVIVQENSAGDVQNATTLQVPGALDDLYAAAAEVRDLGVSLGAFGTRFKLWAPTAQKVYVFTYDTPTSAAATVDEMVMDPATGVWSATRSGDLTGKSYRYGVEVFARGVGVVRNLVTDPYSVSLSTDSRRSWIGSLASAATKPAGWDASSIPTRVAAATDMVVYELHPRDFSVGDSSVPVAERGKYAAFARSASNGMRHLKILADAGVTDVHLLPVFDITSVPETGCTTPSPAGAPDGEAQQAAISATAGSDCFNWGYDPLHFNAPEGSYASDPADGATRVREFRQMVMGLHAAGLRVGMDVVFNHTTASGQNEKSILDRIVPGYYHRLSADGTVTNSTCCDNTAPEHLMMGQLMIDSVALWARDYRIASFRFDIMGHLPRPVMKRLRDAVNSAAGREVQLSGEGWNFGEVANDARFVQARQGGLVGSIEDFTLLTHWDATLALKDLGGVGFARQPDEVVNYVENHDNLTLYDVNAMKLPLGTSAADRARVQILGVSTVAFAQGIAYMHAGVEFLRSKSLDRNSYDSGDWFNAYDPTGATHNFGVGLPRAADNGGSWSVMRPFLGDASLKMDAATIAWTNGAFKDLMKIRASTTLLRLRTAADIRARLRFHNLGSGQLPTVLVGHVDGAGYAGANFAELAYFINAGLSDQTVPVPALAGKAFELHPVHASGTDRRAASASYAAGSGTFTIPARTAVVFVVR
jgi:pullulanase/glycogen debranching enzyme